MKYELNIKVNDEYKEGNKVKRRVTDNSQLLIALSVFICLWPES